MEVLISSRAHIVQCYMAKETLNFFSSTETINRIIEVEGSQLSYYNFGHINCDRHYPTPLMYILDR